MRSLDWRKLDPYDLVHRLVRRLGGRPQAISRLLRAATILIVILLVLGLVGVEMSSTPGFCRTCHYMEPYYQSWKTSSHSQVPCVDCHFPPDVESIARRKLAASVQVVKYLTQQYGTRPFTEIEDASCLREGCHEKRLLAGKVDFNGIPFDHGPHLTTFRRVTRLRCTSCHSQIVQGRHMTVTVDTCFLCHFKNIPEKERLSRCGICHTDPAKVKTPAGTFDHASLSARGVGCGECHRGVVQGTGPVARSRCLVCHSEPERLVYYDQHQTKFLHANHVTNHKIECTRCHEEILHQLPAGQHVEASASECTSCHPNQHQQTVQLYRGLSAQGAKGSPDWMASAGVSCQSCHRSHPREAGREIAVTASAAGCMNCHGEQYGKTLARWISQGDQEVRAVEQIVATAEREVGRRSTSRASRDRARELLRQARQTVSFVRDGGVIHNFRYASTLLAGVRQQVNQAMSAIGSSYRAPPAPKEPAQVPAQACRLCHDSPPAQTLQVFGSDFSHEVHVNRASLPCTRCHRDAPLGTPGHGARKLAAATDCLSCHQGRVKSPHPPDWRRVHPGPASTRRDSCRVCHTDAFCEACHGAPVPHPAGWVKQHGARAKTRTRACLQCHSQSYCTSCHGLTMPHASGWAAGTAHGKTALAGPEVCARCHVPKDCLRCHAKQPPGFHQAKDFRQQHGTSVPDTGLCNLCHGPNACQTCHRGVALPHNQDFLLGGHKTVVAAKPSACAYCHPKPDLCLTCHSGAPPASHQADDFRKKHGEKAQPELCALCHGQDPCRTCHGGLTMPHPENFPLEHKKVGSFRRDGPCLKCHKIDTCQMCHADAKVQ